MISPAGVGCACVSWICPLSPASTRQEYEDPGRYLCCNDFSRGRCPGPHHNPGVNFSSPTLCECENSLFHLQGLGLGCQDSHTISARSTHFLPHGGALLTAMSGMTSTSTPGVNGLHAAAESRGSIEASDTALARGATTPRDRESKSGVSLV
jgi:hypothetical protein